MSVSIRSIKKKFYRRFAKSALVYKFNLYEFVRDYKPKFHGFEFLSTTKDIDFTKAKDLEAVILNSPCIYICIGPISREKHKNIRAAVGIRLNNYLTQLIIDYGNTNNGKFALTGDPKLSDDKKVKFTPDYRFLDKTVYYPQGYIYVDEECRTLTWFD